MTTKLDLGRREDISGEIDASIRWLVARIPPCADSMHVLADRISGESWLTFFGPGSTLQVRFETPHRVRCERFDLRGLRSGQATGPPDVFVYNLAMNLQEITDLIRDTLEGHPCPDS